MIDPKVLRPGNWIHCKGSSHYGIVTGEILAQMERDEKFREKFEGIEISGELLETAGFQSDQICFWIEYSINGQVLYLSIGHFKGYVFKYLPTGSLSIQGIEIKYLHHLQNLVFDQTGSELPLPESAKLIPQVLEK